MILKCHSVPGWVINEVNEAVQTIEAETLRKLLKQQYKTSTPIKNAPGWNEALASESEASVKADKSDSPASTLELQEQTVEYITSRYNPDDRKEPTTAGYSREEVNGPLRQAAGNEDSQEAYQTVIRKMSRTSHVVEDDSTTGHV
ncbi:hypothetical protein J132_10122 [Termitomyces sp. J132]|nr:hypothetical protein J132_10122 [Termitomyces sp. J132]